MPDYIAIIEARDRMMAAFSAMISRDEILISPTLPHVAAKVAPLVENDDAFFAMNAKTLRNTQIGNFLDHCGVSIPCGTGEAGMPVGLLLSGLYGTDDRLLGVAMAAEEIIRDW